LAELDKLRAALAPRDDLRPPDVAKACSRWPAPATPRSSMTLTGGSHVRPHEVRSQPAYDSDWLRGHDDTLLAAELLDLQQRARQHGLGGRRSQHDQQKTRVSCRCSTRSNFRRYPL